MKLILLILSFVAVVTGFATMPANATIPGRMTYLGGAEYRAIEGRGGGYIASAQWFEQGNDFSLNDGSIVGRRQ